VEGCLSIPELDCTGSILEFIMFPRFGLDGEPAGGGSEGAGADDETGLRCFRPNEGALRNEEGVVPDLFEIRRELAGPGDVDERRRRMH
jgi:hypothetical protein